MRAWPLPALGLRQRVSLTFGLVALLMSVLLAVTTYVTARNYLWSQRQQVSLRQATSHARSVDEALASNRRSVAGLLMGIDARGGQDASPMLLWKGRWYDNRYPAGVESLPDALIARAEGGQPVMQRVQAPRGLVFAVALPLEDGVYVEVFSLAELERTLRSLATIFAFTTTMTTLLGVIVGGWASRRALLPLRSFTDAASSIARGDLGTRLSAPADADLGPIAEAFNSTASQLEARVQRDARFAGNVSHELRTPVTAMVNAVDILTSRAHLLDEEGREVLEFLTSDVHRFAQLVTDLLETSRIDAGAVDLRPEALQVRSYLAEVADRRVGRPVTRRQGEDPVALIDRRLMDSVVENLVDNAERYGGGVTSVSVERVAGKVRVLVDDSGPGVPVELRERIFERFARGLTSGDNHGGAGLGLALVADSVRLHHGRVWVEDSPEGGARFVVELPEVPG